MHFVVRSLPLLVWLTVITVQVFIPPSEALSITKRGTTLEQPLDAVLNKRHDAEVGDVKILSRADLEVKPDAAATTRRDASIEVPIKSNAIAKRWWFNYKTTYAAITPPRAPKEATTMVLKKRAWFNLRPFLAKEVVHPPPHAIKKRWSPSTGFNWRFGGRASGADMVEERSEKRWTSNPRFNSAVMAVEGPEKRFTDDSKSFALNRRGDQDSSREKVKRPKLHESWTMDPIVNRPFVKRFEDIHPLTDDEMSKRYNVETKPLRAIHL